MRYSTIHHEVRERFQLSLGEYVVCDSYHQLSHAGPCSKTNKEIADFLGLDKSYIGKVLKILAEKGLIEEISNGIQTTELWTDAVTYQVEKSHRKWNNSTKSGKKPLRTIIYNNNNNSNNARAEAPAVSQTPKKEKKEDDSEAPMNLNEFMVWCRASPHRHINIIAEYADERKLTFTTKGQWRQFITRNVRAAKALEPYTNEQIAKAIRKILTASSTGGYLTKWGMETIMKYLE